ncbi:uncharacterized protein LOC123311539 [Coccinella septempunctata]|uniref:uncharacterized protein LOC123311539 n=1 Tax=Coccinella septempunctata TaxID=41139 RepID=UPI001D07E023|nr:uncharacterized protein LOC123311539 [Coccinella septempunctata]
MKTSRSILNDRTKKKSAFHKICTYDHPTPYFGSEELNRYEFSHIKTPPQQLVFHKEEIRPTPISLPTPPASPEFWGTSLQKWYQKKPLFTLTAKGQVKRLEKYLEIQKTLEMCKREHEFQVHTENMKKAYLDFEFREHQPLLYEDKDVCCVCPCNSSRRHDVDFIPVDYISCSPPNPKLCICYDEDEEKKENNEQFQDTHKPTTTRTSPNGVDNFEIYPSFRKTSGFIEEERIIPTKIIKEGEKDPDDRGIYKVIVKNKEIPRIPSARYVMKLYDNKNYESDEQVYHMITDQLNAFHGMPNNTDDFKSGLSKINVGNISLPFDQKNNRCGVTRSRYSSKRSCPSCQCCHSAELKKTSGVQEKYDFNENEIP